MESERGSRAPEILYEDNCLVVVNKPAGALSQGDRSGDRTIVDAVRHALIERGASTHAFLVPVHRLDRPVSGALILARKSKAASRLGTAFREGRVEKVYWAVVEGRPRSNEGTLEAWLKKDRRTNRSRTVAPGMPGAAPAVLRFALLRSAGGLALLEVRPETGRPHQIRVQLAGIGCPIAGDLRYGARRRLGRMMGLHCRRLVFEHPVRHEPVCVEAGTPAGWQRAFGELGF